MSGRTESELRKGKAKNRSGEERDWERKGRRWRQSVGTCVNNEERECAAREKSRERVACDEVRKFARFTATTHTKTPTRTGHSVCRWPGNRQTQTTRHVTNLIT